MRARFIEEWQDCQRRGNALEIQYARAMLAYCRGEGPHPGKEMWAELMAVRKESSRLLNRALSEVHQRVIENGQRIEQL